MMLSIQCMPVRCAAAPRSVSLLAFLVLLGIPTMGSVASGARFQESDPKPSGAATPEALSANEITYEQAAVNSQNKGDFRMAAEHWGRLLEEYPKSTLRVKALHQLGLCEVQTGKYEEAVGHLRDAIRETHSTETQTLARSQLYLGFSQLQLGKMAKAKQDQDAANRWLTSASVSLAKCLDDYPEFEGAHEAAYFRGMALEQMGQVASALEAYARVLDYDNSQFKPDALYALGDLSLTQNATQEAAEYLRSYLQTGESLPAADEVRMRAGDAVWQLALAARDASDAEAFEKLANEAMGYFKTAASAEGFSRRDEAQFKLAMAEYQRGQLDQALQGFQLVAESPDSSLAGLAAMNLGRLHLMRDEFPSATRWLTLAVDRGDEHAAAAAHWLSRALLASGEAAKVAAVVDRWLGTELDVALKSELMMDRADAAFAIPDQQVDSISHFLQVAALNATNAPVALYNAAYAALVTRRHEQAAELADRFESDYPTHPYLPDVVEVRAESLIARGDATQASKQFQRLVTEFSNHPKQALWIVRKAAADYEAGNDAAVEQTLASSIESIQDTSLQSEALYWLGASRIRARQLDGAIEALQNSLKVGVSRKAADTELLLGEAYIAQGDWKNAESALRRLDANHPEQFPAAKGLFLLADHFAETGDAETAETLWKQVAQKASAGIFASYANLKLGWLAADRSDGKAANDLFSKALQGAEADRTLENKARIGLATVARQEKQTDRAKVLLQEVIDEPGDPLLGVDARYEMGLVLSEEQNWGAAAGQFEQLLADPAASGLEANLRYELAWALQKDGKADAAAEQFQVLADRFADTGMGADAAFQIGERAYAAKDYEAASAAYQSAIAHGPAALQEKALYRLGWALYRNADYAGSYARFKEQTDRFRDGPLYADGLYMLGEASFKQNEFDVALEAYRVARPVMESSTTIDRVNVWLGTLHAAQAANRLKKHDEAKALALQLTDDATVDALLRLDAQLELGLAAQGLNDRELAMKAWELAAADLGKTGVHARCLLASALFAGKEYAKAIREFSLVQNGYGGDEVDPDIDPWQALATYEIARCKYAQAMDQGVNPQLKSQLLQEALRDLNELIEKFPNDRLVSEARRQMKIVERAMAQQQ